MCFFFFLKSDRQEMLHLDAKLKKKKKKEEKSTACRKKLSKKLLEDLSPLDVEKARLTEHKLRLNALDKNDPETVKLRKEMQELYRNIVTLYEKVLAQWEIEISTLGSSITEIQAEYDLADYNFNEMLIQREEHNKVGAAITQKLLAHSSVRPLHREGKLRLSREERKFLKDEALFYKELYEEATQDIEQEIFFKDVKKMSIEELNTLTYKKERLSADLSCYESEKKRIRARFRDFNYNNKQLAEIIIVDEQEEAPQLRVKAQLGDDNYDAVTKEYDQLYQAYFLTPLIHMYRMKNVNEIARFSTILIDLLVNPLSAKVIEVYEMLLMSIHLSKEDLPPFIWPLVSTIHSMSQIEAFTEIMRLLVVVVVDQESENVEVDVVGTLVITDEFISEQTEKIEARKAYLLFEPYSVLRKAVIEPYSRYACVYLAETIDEVVAINIRLRTTHSDTEDTVYELLAQKEGFATLKQLFRLEIFPQNIFEPCSLLRQKPFMPVHVYVTEFLPMTLERIVAKDFDDVHVKLDVHDKFCVLFELLFTLQDVKRMHGIQHNQLDLLNLRAKSTIDESRNYKMTNGSIVECRSRYRITLVDFSKASLDPHMPEDERQLLQGADYASFYRLATLQEMTISDRLIETLSTIREEERTFDNLMNLLHASI